MNTPAEQQLREMAERTADETIDSIESRNGWTRSRVEEALAALHLIAGLVAWQAGIFWFAWVLFAKAALDTYCAFRAARER